MGYDVTGWIEATALSPEERDGVASMWQPVLCLDVYFLRGDEISDFLFGLTRDPTGVARFAGRGVPEDCTSVVRQQYAENEESVLAHGEGEFGHTFASLDEIRDALAQESAPRLAGSDWAHVLKSADFILDGLELSVPYRRVVVWASW